MLKCLLLLLIASPIVPSVYAAPVQGQTAAGWSAAARTLLEDYRAGRYALVQQEAQRLLPAESDERVRRDLRALLAMTLLRSESREDRTSGRAMLAALEQEDPAYGVRPECLLAMGVGLLGLNETGAALDNVDAAVDAFVAQGDQPRAVDALAALAATWAAHREWELTPRRFGVALPATPEQAAALRVERIRGVRQRAAGLANAERGLRHIDLTLAVALIESAGDIAGAVEILEQLTSAETVDPPAAAALDRLGSIYSGQRRWDEAVKAYQRLAAAEFGDLSYCARRAAAEIVEPSVTIDAPAAVRPDESLTVEVAARNVESLSLEIRRFDLPGWLAAHQGRLIEGRLSDTGALAAPAVRLTPTIEQPHDLWQSRDAGRPLAFELPKGSYVAIARAKSRDGREHLSQKLVVVSALQAAAFIGQGQVLVWAVAGGEPVDEAEAFFWMNGGTFVAPAREVLDGVAQFALPAEAKLARDKRWSCVLRRGDDLALCRGSLAPASIEPPARDSVLLLMNGLSFDIGETLELRGMIMPASPAQSGSRLAMPPARRLQVDVMDAAQGRVVASFDCPVSNHGTFEASLPLAADLAGRSMHLVVRENGEVLPSVEGQSRFNVQDVSNAGLRPRLLIPPTIDADGRALSGEVVAHYPGGVPATGAGAEIGLYGLSVPAPGQPGLPAPLEAKFFYAQFDQDGRVRFSFPFDALRLEGPWGVADVYARVSGWDDGISVVRSVADIAPVGAAAQSHREDAGASAVAPPAASPPDSGPGAGARITASLVPGGVRVELLQPAGTPTLLLLEDGSPLAAHAWRSGQSGAVMLKADAMRAASAQVLLVEMAADQTMLVQAVDVAFASDSRLSISAVPPAVASREAAPPIRITADAPRERDGFVTLRLTDLTPKGLEDVWREYGELPEKPSTALQMSSSSGEEVAGYEVRGAGLSRRFREAALSGSSVAVNAAPLVDGAAEIRLPVPDAPGDYELVALLRRSDGRYATARLPVDFSQVARAALHVPAALRLGDRTRATITLERYSAARRSPAEVSIDIGAGLSQTVQAIEPHTGDVVDRYSTAVEATNLGSSIASAAIDVDGDAAALEAHYAVYPDRGRFDGVATGLFAETAELSPPPHGWAPGLPTTLVIQPSMADAVIGAAEEWLNEPIEGTAWRVARLLWAQSLLTLRPQWSDRPVSEILAQLRPGPLGRERLSAHAAMTLAGFRDAAMDRLLIAQHRDGGWGRWQSDVPEAPATAWAVDAIETVLPRIEPGGAPRAPSRTRIDAALRQARGWLQGPLSAAPAAAGAPEDAVACLFGLSRAATRDEAMLSKWSALADRVRRSADQLSVQQSIMLATALRRVGRSREADDLVVRAAGSAATRLPSAPGMDSAWIALGQLEQDAADRGAVDDLLAARSGLGWGEPLLTAWSIRAISAGPAPDGDTATTGSLVIRAGGEQVAQQTLSADGSAQRLTLPAAAGLALEHQGQGSLTAAWVGVSVGPAGPPLAAVERQLTLLRLERLDGHNSFIDLGPYTGQPLEPGQHLRVRETWQLTEALAHAEWVQPLPGGFIPWRSGRPAASIGGLERRDRHGLCWAAPSIAAGEHIREYLVIAGAPGTFLFPSPELRAAGRRAAVDVATEPLRLTVVASR